MKLVKSLLLGSAAGLMTVGAASAADLPVRKAAPVEYVRVCDAYGAGFFYIPGTDTCLKVGGLVLAQLGILPATNLYRVSLTTGNTVGNLGAFGAPGIAGYLPAAAAYGSVSQREIFGYTATGRVELDARTQSPFGTVRTFARLTMNYGGGNSYQTGALVTSLGGNGFNNTAGPTIEREGVFLDKAFIQFAGITAGRAQSFFDFYADAINYAGLYGSNSSPFLLAYTFAAGGGWSVTGAIEDPYTHRGSVASVVNVANLGSLSPTAGLNVGGNAAALVGASRMPDVVGNVRWDQPWGAVQVSAALHQIRANQFANTATSNFISSGLVANAAYANPTSSYSGFGFAVQGGAQFNLDMLAPGDKLWLQATYAKGSIGYIQGNTFAFTSGINGSAQYGTGITRSTNSVGWNGYADVDCVFTYTGGCDKSSGFSVLAALKHYWTPTISSGFFGNYYQVTYSNAAQYPVNPFAFIANAGGAAAGSGPLFSGGITNFRQTRLGTNLVWTPVKNFDIGAEMTWAHYMVARPFGLAPDAVLQSYGVPKFTSTTDQFIGALRVIRAF